MNFKSPADLRQDASLFWRLQVIGWTGTLIVSIGMISYVPMTDAFILAVLRATFGLLVTSFALRPLYQWMRRTSPPLRRSYLVLIAVCCVSIGMIDTAVMNGVLFMVDPAHSQLPEVRQFLAISTTIRTVLYGVWTLLYFGIHYYIESQEKQLRAAQTEAALRAGELQMLRSQVNPHFLFNALNSILAASEDPPVTRKITLALSDYLRFSLQQRGDTERLGVELSALESYLQVEKTRFESNLDYGIEADPSVRNATVPVAIVQPLLENAIKYGAQSTIRPLKIRIYACLEGETITLRVANSGTWIGPELHSSTGIGLANLRRRLELLYGSSASITHKASLEEVVAIIRLPLITPLPLHG